MKRHNYWEGFDDFVIGLFAIFCFICLVCLILNFLETATFLATLAGVLMGLIAFLFLVIQVPAWIGKAVKAIYNDFTKDKK